jgi:hypothetical protein
MSQCKEAALREEYVLDIAPNRNCSATDILFRQFCHLHPRTKLCHPSRDETKLFLEVSFEQLSVHALFEGGKCRQQGTSAKPTQ